MTFDIVQQKGKLSVLEKIIDNHTGGTSNLPTSLFTFSVLFIIATVVTFVVINMLMMIISGEGKFSIGRFVGITIISLFMASFAIFLNIFLHADSRHDRATLEGKYGKVFAEEYLIPYIEEQEKERYYIQSFTLIESSSDHDNNSFIQSIDEKMGKNLEQEQIHSEIIITNEHGEAKKYKVKSPIFYTLGEDENPYIEWHELPTSPGFSIKDKVNPVIYFPKNSTHR